METSSRKAVSVSVARDFSEFPAGRFTTDGPFPGATFRDNHLAPAFRATDGTVTVDLDGTVGYGSSFLEEAFGGLVREHGFTAEQLRRRLKIKSDSDESLIVEIWDYIQKA